MATRICPICREEIQAEALKCRFCGRVFVPETWKGDVELWLSDPGEFQRVRWKAMDSSQKEFFQTLTSLLRSEAPEELQKLRPTKKTHASGYWIPIGLLLLLLFVLVPNLKDALAKAKQRRLAGASAEAQAATPEQHVAGTRPKGLEFTVESLRIESEFRCRTSRTQAAVGGSGKLYGCIAGSAETVKIFINEIPGTEDIENIKLMWNEWTKDRGWGIGVDRGTAESFVRKLSTIYAPEVAAAIRSAYFGRERKRLTTDRFHIEYRWTPGPAIDEHLLVLEPR